jgi:hypothetical protein
MAAGTLSLALPLALDGESITGSSTAIAVLSVVSIVGGYLLLFALWYFVFRDRGEKPPQSAQDERPAVSMKGDPTAAHGRKRRP